MNKKRLAFTLAEALILLLVASLLTAALIPVFTKKHRELSAHGKWICTINNNGQHVIKTIYNGKGSSFETSGSSCVFTPPANVKNFTVKAVGGGGGGAGGTSGTSESFYDSRIDGMTFAKAVKHTGNYNVTYVGGGGGGGGMGCGEAKNYPVPNLADDGYFDKSHKGYLDRVDWDWSIADQKHTNSKDDQVNLKSPYDGKNYIYGYVDQPVSTFQYRLLTKNDKRYTDTQDTSKYALTSVTTGKYTGTNETAYEFKYHYLEDPDLLKLKALCFPENNWPLSKDINGAKGIYLREPNKNNVKCWNLPGEGGMNAPSYSSSVYLNAGQSVYATVGRSGKGISGTDYQNVGLYLPVGAGSLSLTNGYVYNGLNGGPGKDTVIDFGQGGGKSTGGRGGYARAISYLTYVNIPVMECPVQRSDNGGPFDNNPSSTCDNTRVGSEWECTRNPGCYTSWDHDYIDCSCSDRYYSCYDYTTGYDEKGEPIIRSCSPIYSDWYLRCNSRQHYGPVYYVDQSSCRQVMRATYFSEVVRSCMYNGIPKVVDLNTNSLKPDDLNADYSGVDYPKFNSPIQEVKVSGDDTDISGLFGLKRYRGEPGSGGYGLGETVKNYIVFLSDKAVAILRGEDGEDGGAIIQRTTYMGGSGGQAGYYLSTMFKKLDKLNIKVGRGGAPSVGDSQSDGFRGGTTIIQQGSSTIASLSGGTPGQANKFSLSSFSGGAPGGNGASSPLENPSNRAKIIPFGGRSGSNSNMSGYSARTEVWTNPTASALGVAGSVSLYFTGGHPLDVTYGAGGGGGAGGVGAAGSGGAGAPGVVIIEW